LPFPCLKSSLYNFPSGRRSGAAPAFLFSFTSFSVDPLMPRFRPIRPGRARKKPGMILRTGQMPSSTTFTQDFFVLFFVPPEKFALTSFDFFLAV